MESNKKRKDFFENEKISWLIEIEDILSIFRLPHLLDSLNNSTITMSKIMPHQSTISDLKKESSWKKSFLSTRMRILALELISPMSSNKTSPSSLNTCCCTIKGIFRESCFDLIDISEKKILFKKIPCCSHGNLRVYLKRKSRIVDHSLIVVIFFSNSKSKKE